MELRQLLIFCTAAELLNFTKAGLSLGYAQSNITGQIRLLEEELQVRLFERFGRNIQLTNEGKTFYQKAHHILNLCEEAKSEFSSDDISGVLNIGAVETICVYHLPNILSQYRKLYPKVEIRIQTDVCDRFLELVKNNTIDIALVLTEKIKSSEMTIQTLNYEPMSVIVSPNHPLADKKMITPKDFSNECLITTLPGCGYRPLILSLFEKHGVKPGSLMELSSVASIKHCTIAGLGIAILPHVSVKSHVKSGSLVELKLRGIEFDVKKQLIYHQKKWLTPAMKVFLDLCSSSLQVVDTY